MLLQAAASTRADSMMWLWLFLFGACVLYATWNGFRDRALHKQRSARLRRRPVLSKGEWLSVHAAEFDPDDAFAVAEKVAEWLGCDATQIYPADRFDSELVQARGWHLTQGDGAMDVFAEWLEEVFGELRLDEQFDAVGDVIRGVAASRNAARTDKQSVAPS